ncbi:MAG: hypothetical protein ACYT04_79840 [Nostoc sp.]
MYNKAICGYLTKAGECKRRKFSQRSLTTKKENLSGVVSRLRRYRVVGVILRKFVFLSLIQNGD